MTYRAIYFEQPIPYDDGLVLQHALHEARNAERIGDTVLFLQHTPVVTLGNRGRENHLLVTPEALAARGIDLAHTSRGGDATYHAPGQLVMYPIMRLGGHEADAHGYLWNLEEIAVRTAADFGVKAFRRESMNGAWTDQGKISAIGFRIKRWITLHGMSFNVHPDLTGFQYIVPCGLVGERVCSLQSVRGDACPSVLEVAHCMSKHFESVFGRRLQFLEAGSQSPSEWEDLVKASH